MLNLQLTGHIWPKGQSHPAHGLTMSHGICSGEAVAKATLRFGTRPCPLPIAVAVATLWFGTGPRPLPIAVGSGLDQPFSLHQPWAKSSSPVWLDWGWIAPDPSAQLDGACCTHPRHQIGSTSCIQPVDRPVTAHLAYQPNKVEHYYSKPKKKPTYKLLNGIPLPGLTSVNSLFLWVYCMLACLSLYCPAFLTSPCILCSNFSLLTLCFLYVLSQCLIKWAPAHKILCYVYIYFG